jgi:hypothetical protein
VRISAIDPSCSTIAPMSCTSKCRMPMWRLPASRVIANVS